jgi:hypothetical protein
MFESNIPHVVDSILSRRRCDVMPQWCTEMCSTCVVQFDMQEYSKQLKGTAAAAAAAAPEGKNVRSVMPQWRTE